MILKVATGLASISVPMVDLTLTEIVFQLPAKLQQIKTTVCRLRLMSVALGLATSAFLTAAVVVSLFLKM